MIPVPLLTIVLVTRQFSRFSTNDNMLGFPRQQIRQILGPKNWDIVWCYIATTTAAQERAATFLPHLTHSPLIVRQAGAARNLPWTLTTGCNTRALSCRPSLTLRSSFISTYFEMKWNVAGKTRYYTNKFIILHELVHDSPFSGLTGKQILN